MIDLPRVDGGWRCFIADPPWRFNDRNTRGAAARHYDTMAWEEIAGMRIWEIAAADAVLGLWTPDTHLEAALAVVKAWDFTYRHLYPWIKMSETGRLQIGLGHYMRKCHEVALICTRGKPAILDHGVPSVCLAPRTVHSAKPIDLHVGLERLCRGPRLELFARARRPGWTAWGNEISDPP